MILLMFTTINIASANENVTTGHDDLLEQSVCDEITVSNINQEEQLSVTNDSEMCSVVNGDEVLSYSDAVEHSSTADRTFKIGKYKITLSKYQYSNFLNIVREESNNDFWDMEGGERYGPYTVTAYWDIYDNEYRGLTYSVVKYTGKTVKQKLGYGFKGYEYKSVKVFSKKSDAVKYKNQLNKKYVYSHYVVKTIKVKNKIKYRVCKEVPKFKKVVTKNAKVYVEIVYGACQGSEPGRFTMRVYTQFDNPGYEVVSGWIGTYKTSSSFLKLR